MGALTNIQKIFVRPFDLLELKGIGAEIGVFEGKHAYQLLKRHPSIKRLFCIDPYKTYDDNQANSLDVAEKLAHNRLLHDIRVTFIKDNFQSAFENYSKEWMDFIYIDGDHRYEYVKNDIKTAWPFIKKGGVMGGHDFHHTWPGVIKAVTEFSVKNQLTLCVETPDWWIFKYEKTN